MKNNNRLINLSDLMDYIHDANTKVLKDIGSLDIGLWNDGTVTINVYDPIGNTIYTEDMTASQAYDTVRGMVLGMMLHQGKDI